MNVQANIIDCIKKAIRNHNRELEISKNAFKINTFEKQEKPNTLFPKR